MADYKVQETSLVAVADAIREKAGKSAYLVFPDVFVEAAKAETRAALQTVYDSLNQGQQKKIVKDEKVKALFDLYGVEYSE